MEDPAPDTPHDALHTLSGDEATVLARLKSHVTRLLAAQLIADPEFPNRRSLPRPLPPPFSNFGHQLLVDYERLLRIVWKVALGVRAAVIGKRLRRSSIKWIPWTIGLLALAGSLLVFGLLGLVPGLLLLWISVAGVRWAKKSEYRNVARVRGKAIQRLLEDRFEDGVDALNAEPHHHGDGALDGPSVPVLTILKGGSPFPGFGSLQATKSFVCPPQAGGRSSAIVDLARTIRNQVIARAIGQKDVVIHQGEVIVVHGAKLFMDSAWLGPDKAPLLWFPRAELPRVQDVDPRASVRVFHATQLVFPRYAAIATIFFRVFRAGDSVAFKISMTTLGPPSRDTADLLTQLSEHKLAGHGGPGLRKPSQKTSMMDEILRYLGLADPAPQTGLPFQGDLDIKEVAALNPNRERARGSEDSILLKQIADNSILWPGPTLEPVPNLREQHSLPFTTDFFGRPESLAHVRALYDQFVRCALEEIDEAGFDISRYRDGLPPRPSAVRTEPSAASIFDLESMRTERSVVHALVLAANPPETVRLRIDEEIRSIDEAIRRGRYRDRFELVAQLAVREDDLQGHLLRYQPEILHFAGHGEAGGLILEDGQGGARQLDTEDLRVLIALLGRRIRCVVLNACLTRSQAEILAQHVPAVIGMSRTIDDPLAIQFAAGFYEALAYGESVRSAFELGSQRFANGTHRGAPRDVMAAIDAAAPANAPVLLGNTDPAEIRFFG